MELLFTLYFCLFLNIITIEYFYPFKKNSIFRNKGIFRSRQSFSIIFFLNKYEKLGNIILLIWLCLCNCCLFISLYPAVIKCSIRNHFIILLFLRTELFPSIPLSLLLIKQCFQAQIRIIDMYSVKKVRHEFQATQGL